MIKIEQNIAPPLGGKTLGAALDAMKVGDSFLLQNAPADIRQPLHQQMRKRKLKGQQFISRTLPEGIRVWRLA